MSGKRFQLSNSMIFLTIIIKKVQKTVTYLEHKVGYGAQILLKSKLDLYFSKRMLVTKFQASISNNSGENPENCKWTLLGRQPAGQRHTIIRTV
jgi:hypothetical protein